MVPNFFVQALREVCLYDSYCAALWVNVGLDWVVDWICAGLLSGEVLACC
jgi:hypothetical protein